ncbi:MAG: hypothetical protein JSR79_11415, partial [Proteobacteria bacterium]|nr:hypothetical protein [Pseudomonadota bacterium]
MWKLAFGAAALLCATSVSAQTIKFDEFAADDVNGAIASNRYAYLGVTFGGSTDGATRGGIANGDPGSWGVNGTNGPIFSGFNGNGASGYTQTLTFASNIGFFSLDASRTNGSSDGTVLLQGYLNNIL